MRTYRQNRSFFAPDFPLKQWCARRPGPVLEPGIAGNHAAALFVEICMITRSTPGGRVWTRRLRLLSGCLLLLTLSLPHALLAADRIASAIDNSRRVTLPGHVSPRIASAVDQGSADPSMPLPYVTLMFKPSPSQQADLERLLAQQQDPSSPDYHNWLTPEQYADRFGLSQADIDKTVAWLTQHGLTVKSVARGRNAIAFGGTAGQIGSALGVDIHRYQVGGELHYANAADPKIPAALQGVVLAVRGLNDFRLKPRLKLMSRPTTHPRDTQSGTHYLAPDDIATIYDVTPLYNAGIDGTGQTLVVVGQTDIVMSDITYFRSYFGLPAKSPAVNVTLVPGSPDPGIQDASGDLAESDLDLELASGVARNATILFVTASDVETSLEYAIDQNLAPVITTSYGDCELDAGSSLAQALASVASQANAQGQTLFAASGDYGAADCYGLGDGPSIDNAASVDLPAGLPQVTGIGGTEFHEGAGNYWNATNTATHASARSYIPETAWNDSVAEQEPASSGGGVSVFFPQPSWQTGAGFLTGGRNVPDVSLSASNLQDVYEVYTDAIFQGYGGTSAGAPQFAGVTVLLGQYLVANGYQAGPKLGNINPTLYALESVSGVYHDITTGSNIVSPCVSCASVGYKAGPGYDPVTGLGSPDVYNLVTNWHAHSVAGPQSVTTTLTAKPGSVTFTGTTVLTATVTGAAGLTPTGTVTFSVETSSLGTATLSGSGSSATATLTLSGAQLAPGANPITASYSGDSAYYGDAASTSVTETTPSNDAPNIGGVLDGASYSNPATALHAVAAGGILSVFGTELAPTTFPAPSVPLPTMLAGTTATINGYSAPLYYVSPGQLNLQIPYEVSLGLGSTLVTLILDDNGANAYYSFYVADAAPAIFTTNSQGTGQGAILINNTSYVVDANHPATPGSTYIQIYCIGLGPVSNEPADGAASPSGPLAQTSTEAKVTIGGVTEDAVFTGLAPGFVGLYQVNALVPTGLTTTGGNANVTISMNGITSNTVTIAIAP